MKSNTTDRYHPHHNHFWEFLKRRFYGVVDVEVSTSKKHRLRTTADLKRIKTSMYCKEEIIRLESKAHFTRFSEVFGTHMTIGSRKKKPRLGSRPEPIKMCDTINYIPYEQNVDNELSPCRPRKFVRVLPASRGGLDFVCNMSTSDFSIRIRYTKKQYSDIQTSVEDSCSYAPNPPTGSGCVNIGDLLD